MVISEFGDRCEQCGYVYDPDGWPAAGEAIVAGVAEITDAVGANAASHQRPAPGVWSPHEYACHVRDVLQIQRERVLTARRIDEPSFVPMGRDERVDHDGYAEQHLDDVLRQLRDAALLFGNVLDRLDPAGWDRTVVYNFPAPAQRTLKWVAVHTLHEVRHHLADVRH